MFLYQNCPNQLYRRELKLCLLGIAWAIFQRLQMFLYQNCLNQLCRQELKLCLLGIAWAIFQNIRCATFATALFIEGQKSQGWGSRIWSSWPNIIWRASCNWSHDCFKVVWWTWVCGADCLLYLHWNLECVSSIIEKFRLCIHMSQALCWPTIPNSRHCF